MNFLIVISIWRRRKWKQTLAGAKARPFLSTLFGPAEAVPLLQSKLLEHAAILQDAVLRYSKRRLQRGIENGR
jgi:hypothetical protein